jgi:Leucine-rich repeat (LRR) protein
MYAFAFDERLFNRPEIYRIINELFTDDICEQLKKELKDEKFLFVSDIRRDEKDFEAGVIRDMQLQYNWVKKLSPFLSLLKFRMNYKMKKGDTLPYLNGDLLYGIWATPVSGEARLLIKQDNINKKDKIYDFNDYEEIMFYHNKNERTTCFSKYKNKSKYKNFIENKNNLYCECFDCLQELNIFSNQITKLENLPKNLQELDVFDNQITKLENLPKNLH